jgi:hypothetical protein
MKYRWNFHIEFGWFSGEVFELLGITFVKFDSDMFVLLGLKFGKLLITLYWAKEMVALGNLDGIELGQHKK